VKMLTSRERLLKTLAGKKADRVPISLYEFDGIYQGWIENYPEYVEILRYAEGKTDKMYFWCPAVENCEFFGEVDREQVRIKTWKEGASSYTKKEIETPLGIISTLLREDEGIHTTWTIEHFCKNKEDIEKLLALRYIPCRPVVDSFFQLDKQLGDKGIPMGDIPDALCMTADVLGFSQFLMAYVEENDLIFKLMDFFQERIYNYLKYILEKSCVGLYRIVGPEYATPPYLSPREFDLLIKPYDTELIKLMHTHGGLARIHSHGKIKKVLNSIKEMEIDAIDPLEPPPDGDIELKEVREILGEKITLIGNIEERLFETGKKEDVETAVKKAIKEGTSGEGGFILCPTAMPLNTPLDKKIQENIIHYIDCGLKYGVL